ncbi:mitogen-activated protein kinase kinase kinase 1 [Dorcoceras hygrometricum]|uniref:Mitogen-activated protein kinase kinase kinase 1 n=1 Tax=Dorcoceras hygrometricum TaxID=472368 RepID=A0A2Z7BRX9_9LAMI|nr:mitogen-activated protein kinase kinase kinase 1 [Dorcoceras hygrometricum]
MESVASSSTPPPNHSHHRHRFGPTQSFSDRITRALHHRLRLLHRSDPHFFILGATGNVYTVSISSTPSCTCPDRAVPCKHILFVFIRVLGVPLDNSCLWRRTLRPCQLHRLLDIPTSVEALADAAVRERFHQLFFKENGGGGSRTPAVVVSDCDGACPVCLEEMKRDTKVVVCETCKNVIHEMCFLAWKRSCGRRYATCVLCRARWRNNGGGEQEKYLNLSAYVDEDNLLEENRRCND